MSVRQYELVYILSPDATEQQIADLEAQIAETVGRFNGQIEKTDNWGRRRLAYEIAHHKEGTYVLHAINASGDLVRELDRRMKVVDYVIRHLIVRVDEEKRVVERTRARRAADAERRQATRPPREPRPADEEVDLDEDEDRFGEGVEA